jgi:hypothetical protein
MPFRNPLKHYDHANRNEGNLFEKNTKTATTQQLHQEPKKFSITSSILGQEFLWNEFLYFAFCINTDDAFLDGFGFN